MFTKQHYEAIATLLQDAAHDPIMVYETDQTPISHWDILVGRFADFMARDNPAFNRARFMKACIPGANVRARK